MSLAGMETQRTQYTKKFTGICIKLSRETTAYKLKQLKFLLQDVIPEIDIRDKKLFLDLIQKLEAKKMLNRYVSEQNKASLLYEMYDAISLPLLANEICSVFEIEKDLLCLKITPIKKFLVKMSDDLNRPPFVEKMKEYLSNEGHDISGEDICPLDIFQTMIQTCVLSEYKLLNLTKMMEFCSRNDLMQRIDEFKKEGRFEKDNLKPWKWEKASGTYEEKLKMLIEHGREFPQDILEINDVRVCLNKEFLIGRGVSDGVYVALGTDGSEKAVKLFFKATHSDLAEEEKNMLTVYKSKELTHVVKYWFLNDDGAFVYLIMELCEETLETFVTNNNLDDLVKHAPDIFQQILKGLASLHRKPNRILHRDLKPLNILRNVHDKWLLADFGIARILPDDESTLLSMQRGTKKWMAVESYDERGTFDGNINVRYKTKSDIQVIGMVAFYILTKGKHPFGEGDRLIEGNLLDGNPVNLNMLDSHPLAKDLISCMLSHDPKDRPSAEEALQHPYLNQTNSSSMEWEMSPTSIKRM